MRFLPVFLDLQAGPVLLIGAGDLARAKLRLLAAAGARIRWYATDGNHDLSGLEPADAARIELAQGDPLAADLSGVIAILCAGAGEIGTAMSARAKAAGLPVNVMDDLSHSSLAGGGAPRARAHRSDAARSDRRSRHLYRPLAQDDPWPHSGISAASPLLGARG
jgi:phosphoglycerate dehydrogenase-like enzyme